MDLPAPARAAGRLQSRRAVKETRTFAALFGGPARMSLGEGVEDHGLASGSGEKISQQSREQAQRGAQAGAGEPQQSADRLRREFADGVIADTATEEGAQGLLDDPQQHDRRGCQDRQQEEEIGIGVSALPGPHQSDARPFDDGGAVFRRGTRLHKRAGADHRGCAAGPGEQTHSRPVVREPLQVGCVEVRLRPEGSVPRPSAAREDGPVGFRLTMPAARLAHGTAQSVLPLVLCDPRPVVGGRAVEGRAFPTRPLAAARRVTGGRQRSRPGLRLPALALVPGPVPPVLVVIAAIVRDGSVPADEWPPPVSPGSAAACGSCRDGTTGV